jgi:hypothetical protein
MDNLSCSFQRYLKTYFHLRPVEKKSFTAGRTILAANFFQ